MQSEFKKFGKSLRETGIEALQQWFTQDAIDGGGWGTGEFTLLATLAGSLMTSVAGLAGAWIQGKYGRKIRVKFGDTEVEARTLDEVKKTLVLVEEHQQREQSKIIIHEPRIISNGYARALRTDC